MASGSFISSTGTNLNLYVTWSSTANVSTNTSSVTAKVYMRSYTISGSALTDSYITINGNKKSFAGKSLTKTSNTLTDTLLVEHTVSVEHGSDGKKSITIKANLEFNGTVSGKYLSDVTTSKTVALDTIPRASGLSVATSVNTGSSLTATITPASTSFTHKISYIIGNTTMFTSDAIPANTKIYTHTIEHSWLPKLTSTNMVVRLFTYSSSTQNDSTRIGITDKTVSVSVPDSIKATVTNLKATVVNGLGGYYVEGKSKVKLEATAKAGDGSTLSSYVFSGPNISSSSSTLTTTSSTVTSSVINTDGSVKYGVIAKDGRPDRQSAKKETSITVYPYTAPKITSITAQRCKSDGTLDDNGTYARVVIKTSHSPVNAANYITVKLSNSLNSTQTDVVVKSYASKSDNTYTVKAYGGSFATNTSYTITAVITDYYNTGTTLIKSTTLKAAKRTLNIAKYGNGISIGALSTVTSSTAAGKFECNWDSYFSQDVKISNSTPQYFEVNRTNLPDDVNQDGVDETVDVRGQLYINDSGNVTLRRRYSPLGESNYVTQTFFQLQDNRAYIESNLFVNGTTTTHYGRFIGTNDVSGTSQENVALRVGYAAGLHIDFDGNEIQAKDSPTTASVLNLNYDGGEITFGGNFISRKNNQGYRGTRTDGTQVSLIRINDKNDLVLGELSSGINTTYLGGVYGNTSTSAANVLVDSNSRLYRSSSSSQIYKTNIQDIQSDILNPERLYNLPVREFKFKEGYLAEEDSRINMLVPGFIAEEVAEVYPIACEYDGDKPENWNIRFIVPAMLKLIQNQKKEIDTLKEQLNNKVVS